jgi:beta-fructofuranosidase
MPEASPNFLSRRALLAGSAALAGAAAARRFTPINAVLAAASPAQLAADPRRPQYHLLPAANWINDPNGPIYWRGEYHMFYQYTLDAAGSGPKLWGHAISPDKLHWRHLPVALSPTPGGPDAGGCWTGSALPYGDRVAFLYTGVVSAPENAATTRDGAHSLRESQCLGFASGSDLTAWIKEPAAVIAAPPPGLDVTGFRDPCPWRDGDTWYLALGSGIRGRGGAVLLYHSSDLRHWEYLHPLFRGAQDSSDPVIGGHMWECPDFFPLGDHHVLIHSNGGRAFWQSGVLDRASMTFHSERSGVLDYGSFYAPKTQLDAHGNRVLWGWITEARPEPEYSAAGWAGMMSLPRILTLDADHNLCIAVAPEVEKLRRQQQQFRAIGGEPADRQQLASLSVRDACGQIVCSFRRASDPLEISLVSPAPVEKTWLTCRFDPARPNEISIDGKGVPLEAAGAPEVDLRFYIDGSVIESFAGQYGTLTKRFYYEGSVAPPIGVRIGGRLEALTALSISQIAPISSDRLTS